MAGDKIGLPAPNQIGSVNSAWPEAQVGDGDRPRFLGVIDEVALGIIVGLLADDLDGVFVGSYRAIRA